MTKELEISIENLYQVFSKYPLPEKIEGCPCCVSDSDKSTLHSKPLKKLTDEDLSRFAFKAMSTFGNLQDFKHFLPRIMELSVKDLLMVDEFIVLNKLDYGNWNSWPVSEQEAIITLIQNWWYFKINNQSGFDLFLFIEIDKKITDLSLLLACWETNPESTGFKNLLDFIEFHYSNLAYKSEEFKHWDSKQIETLKQWIDSKTEVIEQGFFVHDRKNKELAASASNALYILETMNKNRIADQP